MPGTMYFKNKLDREKKGDSSLHGGHNSYMPGTPYFKNRLEREKRGDSSLH